MDEQSALPSVYGVPAWAAVAIGVLGAILGIVVDHFVGSGELTARFAVIYVLGCTVAALAGGSLLGLLGALIAIPVAASILIIYRQVIIPRQNER